MDKPRNRLRVLRAGRLSRGKPAPISQRDLALAIGISAGRYWAIENRYMDPTDAERKALAAFFKVDESEVFQYDEVGAR